MKGILTISELGLESHHINRDGVLGRDVEGRLYGADGIELVDPGAFEESGVHQHHDQAIEVRGSDQLVDAALSGAGHEAVDGVRGADGLRTVMAGETGTKKVEI